MGGGAVEVLLGIVLSDTNKAEWSPFIPYPLEHVPTDLLGPRSIPSKDNGSDSLLRQRKETP